MNARDLILVAVLAVLAVAAGCGKSEAPKIDAAKQREDALEASRKGVFGNQVKALDTAKGLQDEINRKAMENVDKSEKDAVR